MMHDWDGWELENSMRSAFWLDDDDDGGGSGGGDDDDDDDDDKNNYKRWPN